MFQFEFMAERKTMSEIKAVRQEKILSFSRERVSHFVLFRPSSDWIEPTHIKDSNQALFSLLIQMLISSKIILAKCWAPYGQVKLAH